MYSVFKQIVILSIITSFFILISSTKVLQEYDLKIYDLTALTFGIYNKENNPSSNVVIVNIDNKSINQIGQWPWSRIIYAQLISNINEMTPATIGFNMHFCHKDKASPIVIKKFYQKYFNLDTSLKNIPKELQNNDSFLAQKLAESKSVLSVNLTNANKKTANHCNDLSYNILNLNGIKNIPSANYLECNTPEFHQKNPHFGFTTIPLDRDGHVREIPLLKSYKQQVIPSFALATLLSLNIHDYDSKKKTLTFLDEPILLENKNKLLLPHTLSSSHTFSAIDVLRKEISSEEFHGKIVLIGSTIDNNLLHEKKTYSSIVHASYIESLLNHTFLVQNEFYKTFNIALAFFLSIVLYIFFKKRWYLSTLTLILSTMTISLLWLISKFQEGIYISIGYLWFPLLIIYSVLLVKIFFSKNNKEKEALKKDLHKSLQSTASSMALVANTHDQETGEHIIRTKKYVKLLAVQLYKRGLYSDFITPHQIELITEAAPLHDIGKVGISDSILKKPGKLTGEEFEIMKTHSQLGANIIKQSLENYDNNPLLSIAYNISLYHHERWDGKGYPNGLKEDEIPIEAQLMTIADVYDALINKRRYKEAFTYEDAESIIIAERGKAFNPMLVDIFIEQKEKFKAISLEWNEEQIA